MKDLTHYFQSPNKAVNSATSPEYSMDIEVSPAPNLNSCDGDSSVSPCFEATAKGGNCNKFINGDTTKCCDIEESQMLPNSSEVGNGIDQPKKSGKRFKERVKDLKDTEKQITAMELAVGSSKKCSKLPSSPNEINDSVKKLGKSCERNGLPEIVEKCSSSDTLNTIEEKSPNAFQILMSTQQVFGSANCGKKGNSDGVVENGLNLDYKKKIKENLEKMSKRKMEMEATLCKKENSILKPSRKRRRIIMESDMEDETLPNIMSVPDVIPCTTDNTKSKKQNQLEVVVTAKNKKRKNNEISHEVDFSQKKKDDSIPISPLKNKRKVGNQENKAKQMKVKKTKKHDKNEVDSSEQNKIYTDQVDVSVLEIKNGTEMDVEEESIVSSGKKFSESSTAVKIINLEDSNKRKSNILNYFNKVSDDVKEGHSEKIKVTVDVHFPTVSSNKVYKKGMLRKKSKRKGQSEKEDDILLIDSELIEKPNLPKKEINSSAVLCVPEIVTDKASPTAKEIKKTNRLAEDPSLAAANTSFSQKDWKLRIRITPSPERKYRKSGPLLKRGKLKLTSKTDISVFDDASVKNVSEEENKCDKLLDNSPLNVKKSSMKNKLISEEKYSVKSNALSRRSTRSTPEKVKFVRDNNDVIAESKQPAFEKSIILNGRSMSPGRDNSVVQQSSGARSSTRRGVSGTPDGKKSAKLKNSFPSRRKLIERTNESSDPSDSITSDEVSASLTKKINVNEESLDSVSSSPKILNKKKRSPKKKSAVNDAKMNLMKKESSGKRCKKEVTPIPTRKRNSASKNINSKVVCCITSKKSSVVKTKVSGGNKSLSSSRKSNVLPEKEIYSGSKTLDSMERNSSPINVLCSSRKRSVTTIPDYGISDDEFSDDDFDDDSDDIFIGDSDDFDSDDDIYIGIDNCVDDDDDDDDDESIIISKKNNKKGKTDRKEVKRTNKKEIKRKVAIGITLDQNEVLQFLKKAKGTLNRKMALNDPANISSEPTSDCGNNTGPVKLAPVFVSQKTKKPSKASLLARKTFLQSGVPEVVKKMVEIQKLSYEQEHIMFPLVSHTQQKKEDELVWNLPNALHKFSSAALEPVFKTPLKLPIGDFTHRYSESSSSSSYSASRPPKIKLFQDFLRAIKAESPDFPVYRTFRQLSAMFQPQLREQSKNDSTKKRKQRSSLNKKENQGNNVQDSEQPCTAWTTKYCPCSSSDILGNGHNVSRLKKWLELWVQVKENTLQKNLKEDLSSGDEFINDGSDDESGRTVLPKKTAVLLGPTGSGKTMTVYTLAHELGYKVLEVNASAKRAGRRILSEVLEATQSHQVHGKGEETTSGIKNFFPNKAKSGKVKKPKKEKDQQSNKLSLILVEDVDIVFEEEDEGFVTALSSLLVGTKTPVVLTTSDPSSSYLPRFLENSLVFEFKPPPSKYISVWLQLVSLVEGVRVQKSSVEELLKYNKNDVRKTLLQLQFWVLSGGDNLKSLTKSSESTSIQDFPDNVSNSSWLSIDDKNATDDTYHPINTHCLNPFLELDPHILSIDKGKTWWNLPKLVGLREVCHAVSKKEDNKPSRECDDGSTDGVEIAANAMSEDCENEKKEVARSKWKSVCCSEDVVALSKLSDVLSAVELLTTAIDYRASEPYQCSWEKSPVDSLCLSQDMRSSECGVQCTSQSIGSWLVATSVNECRPMSADQLCPKSNRPQAFVLQQQAPEEEIRWRDQQHSASKELENAVAMLYWSQRGTMAMDYIPCLRYISRLEQERGFINEKRNNRFYHYLKGLGAHPNPAILDTVCNTFNLHEQI